MEHLEDTFFPIKKKQGKDSVEYLFFSEFLRHGNKGIWGPIEKRSVTSHYHGTKISGSQQ